MNPELERIWPDEDRRDAALERVLLRTAAGTIFLRGQAEPAGQGYGRLHRG